MLLLSKSVGDWSLCSYHSVHAQTARPVAVLTPCLTETDQVAFAKLGIKMKPLANKDESSARNEKR